MENDLSQQQLADRLHVSDRAVSKWERGLCYPDVTIMEELAAALELSLTELMSCRRQPEPQAEEDAAEDARAAAEAQAAEEGTEEQAEE